MSAINTPQLQKLWADVQTKPEWATTKFWEYLFKQQVFTSRQWAVASQQPPTDDEDDLRRVDLVVENIDDNLNSTTLLFMEAKRANASRDQIDQVEYQAYTACCANLFHTERSAIWAMTCVGTKTRLWAYQYGDDYVTQFWPPGDGLSERGEYAEFSAQGHEILKVLDFIKRNPIPDESVFLNPPSPRPADPRLPLGWHDKEVALIASAASSHANAGPSTSVQQLPNDASTSQHQPASTYQNMIVDASQSYEVIVGKLKDRVYECKRLVDNGHFEVPEDGWVECGILVSGNLYSGYSWMAGSGRQYHTWSLESERKRGKKARK